MLLWWMTVTVHRTLSALGDHSLSWVQPAASEFTWCILDICSFQISPWNVISNVGGGAYWEVLDYGGGSLMNGLVLSSRWWVRLCSASTCKIWLFKRVWGLPTSHPLALALTVSRAGSLSPPAMILSFLSPHQKHMLAPCFL